MNGDCFAGREVISYTADMMYFVSICILLDGNTVRTQCHCDLQLGGLFYCKLSHTAVLSNVILPIDESNQTNVHYRVTY